MGDTCSSCPPKDAPSSGPEHTESTLGRNTSGRRRIGRALGDAVDDTPEHIKLATYKTAKSPDANARELISKAMKSDRVCAMLEEGHFNSVLQSVEYFEFPATTRVVKQGDTGDAFFVIDEGTLLVEMSGKVVNTMDRGKAFGSLALLYRCPRTASVTAQSACGCWGVTFETLHRVLEETGQKRYAENRKFVDSLRLFDALTSRQKDCFAEEVFAVVFETPGERVVTQGDTSSAIHFVKSGELQAFSGGTVSTTGKHEGGREVARFRAGEGFGERSMLHQEPHQTTVITVTKCELLVIGRESMIKVLGNDYNDFLERSFLSAGLRKSQEISHLNFEQQRALMETMTVKNLPPNDRVEPGLRLAIVVDGSLVTADGSKTKLPRGQWFEEDAVKRVAGPEGCRLGILRRADFDRTLKGLGFDSEEHTRKMMVVRKVPLFRFLSDTQVADFVKSFAMKKYVKGQVVFKQGDPGQTFHGIANGEVNVLIDGKLVRTMGAGAVFGDRALLTDDKRSATVEVASLQCDIWSIEKAVFQQILSDNMRKELQQRINLQDTTVVLKELRHVKVIGMGASGVVRLVEHKTTRMRYALKRVKKKRGRIPEEVERETRLLAENDHPMVMAMVKTFETATSVYMLTELITGGELFSAIRNMPILTCAQAQFYIGSLSLVLEALADRMIVYRDLKPENVLLDSQGYLKLVDFGIAKKLEEGHARTFTRVGTPHYMAPEVPKGMGYGLEVDIWSLGVLLYELVCGYLPFADDAEDQEEVFRAVQKAPLKFPREYKDQVGKDIIEGMLTRQPKKRLGCGINGWEDIKQHSYFRVGYEDSSKRGVTLFTRIMGRELEPPWRPAGEEYSGDTDGATLSDAKELG